MSNDSRNAAQESPGHSAKNDSSWNWLSPKNWIDSIGGVVTGGLGYAPREHVGIIVIAFLLAMVGLIVSIALVYGGQAMLGGIVAFVSLLCLLVPMIMLQLKDRPYPSPKPSPARGLESW